MHKKNIARKGATVLMAAMALPTMGAMPVMAAAGTNYSGVIEGTKTTSFDKYLVMDKQAEVPNAKFTYAVTAGAAKTYNVDTSGGKTKTFEVKAGVDADKVTMAGVGGTNGAPAAAKSIEFHQGDAISADGASDALVKYDPATQKYAKKTATLDFSQCSYTEPGVYRYILTESGTNQAITNDADTTRIVDVYVYDASDDTTKKLTIAGYVLHSNENDSPDVPMGENNGSEGSYNPATVKSQGFSNVYDTSDLTFKKEVAGNQASHDKYFKFTVTIRDAVAGTQYNVDLSDADATVPDTNNDTLAEYQGKVNPTTLTVGADKTVTADFYLQTGQTIKIQGIAKDSTYDVKETPEDYKSEAAAVTDFTDAVNGTVASTDLKTSYKNTRDGSIPTGVIMTVAPFAVVTLLGGVGVVTLMMKKHKDDKEN